MLARIAEAKETLEKKILAEIETRNKLDEKLDVTEMKMMHIREELGQKGGVNAARESAQIQAKQIRVLENRLDKSLQKFNEAVAYNKELRDRVRAARFARRHKIDGVGSQRSISQEFLSMHSWPRRRGTGEPCGSFFRSV